ncbi:MAG: SPOR domain-containing protein [Desulfobulbaceae bacterium]|nr:SPOR domain-containing protein [Desulfobulbaceae bacterium]
MAEEEKTVEKKRKAVHLELSFMSLFFWGIGFVFCLAWIFALGVLAGKGLLPGGAETLGEIKTQIARIQEMIITRDSADVGQIKNPGKDPNLVFYHELSKGGEEPVKRSVPSAAAPKMSEEKKIPPRSASTDRFVVQVASLDDEKKASAMVDRLTSRGHKAYSYKVFVKGRPFYRVRCGLFSSEEEAETIRAQLAEKEGLKGFVKRVLKGDG